LRQLIGLQLEPQNPRDTLEASRHNVDTWSEKQWLDMELNERYSDTCVLTRKGRPSPHLLLDSEQELAESWLNNTKLLSFDTHQFNRSVYEHQGFRYTDGILKHNSYPELEINCIRKRHVQNSTSGVKQNILSILDKFEPRRSKFVCFASFFWYDIDAENDDIQVMCMRRKDLCKRCQNGGECKRYPVGHVTENPFCVCQHNYTGPTCENVKTGLDLNCPSNQVWSTCRPGEVNPLCQPSCGGQKQDKPCNVECPTTGGCACPEGQYLDGKICVPKLLCPDKFKTEHSKEELENTSLGKVIISLASIAAVMVAAVLVWGICICNKKIKDLTHNVKTIPPSLEKSMNKDPSYYDNHYYVSDGYEKKEYAHEIHDILRDTDDVDSASQKTEEETLRDEEDPIFCYPPPTPLISTNKDLLYISIQPLKSSADSGIDESGSFDDDSRTRCSSGDLSVSSPTFLYVIVGREKVDFFEWEQIDLDSL